MNALQREDIASWFLQVQASVAIVQQLLKALSPDILRPLNALAVRENQHPLLQIEEENSEIERQSHKSALQL